MGTRRILLAVIMVSSVFVASAGRAQTPAAVSGAQTSADGDPPILLQRWEAVYSYDVATDESSYVGLPGGPSVDLPVEVYTGGLVRATAVSPDGARVYVTGNSYCLCKGRSYTVAYDATSGTQLWAAHYRQVSYALAMSPDGSRVYVTGTGATVAYDATDGTQLWAAPSHNHDWGNNGWDYGLAVSPDGTRVYMTASSTIAYDAASGTRLWVATGGSDLVVSPDGTRVYVTGDFATVAYDAAGGTQLWIARYNGPGGNHDEAFALAVSPDGARVFVTGQSSTWTSKPSLPRDPPWDTSWASDFATVVYDAVSGVQLWVAIYNSPENSRDSAFALAVSPDGGRVYVTGDTFTDPGVYVGRTVAYDATDGAQLSVSLPGESGYALTVSPDGTKVYVAGSSTVAYCTSALALTACLTGTQY